MLLALALPVAAIILGIAARALRSIAMAIPWGGLATAAIWLASAQIVLGVVVGLYNTNVNHRAGSVICASHLRQIGRGIMLYSNDHGGQYPDGLERLIAGDYCSPDLFICPLTDQVRATGPTTQAIVSDFQKPGHCSYVYVGSGWAGYMPLQILAYERPGNHGRDGMNVLFGDGHVDAVDAATGADIRRELFLGFNPPRPLTPPATQSPGP